jgi:hypothetical protein
MNVFVAKEQPGGCAGYEWTVGGDKGAIEMPAWRANELCAIQHSDFYVIDTPVKAVEKKAEKSASTAPEVENPSEELNEATETSSPTRRRSTKTEK